MITLYFHLYAAVGHLVVRSSHIDVVFVGCTMVDEHT